MDSNRKYKLRRLKEKVVKFFQVILCFIYFSSTFCIPTYVFISTFLLKGNIIYAITMLILSFTIMDIVCSITEDSSEMLYNLYYNRKRKTENRKKEIQEKKEKEIKKLEELLLESNNYTNEIKEAKQDNKDFKHKIEISEKELPKEIMDQLLNICKKVKDILEILKNDPEEYYPIRHTFKVYFPKFREMTYQYINIAMGDSLEEETTTEFMELIAEFNQYLDFVKSSINMKDKLNLNVGIKSLIKIMATERKKGED